MMRYFLKKIGKKEEKRLSFGNISWLVELGRFVPFARDSFASLGISMSEGTSCQRQDVDFVRFVLCAGDSFAALGISVSIGLPIFLRFARNIGVRRDLLSTAGRRRRTPHRSNLLPIAGRQLGEVCAMCTRFLRCARNIGVNRVAYIPSLRSEYRCQ